MIGFFMLFFEFLLLYIEDDTNKQKVAYLVQKHEKWRITREKILK